MTNPNDFRGEYTNPALTGAEALDLLYVTAHPYEALSDYRDRHRVLALGLAVGVPGFGRLGLLSMEKIARIVYDTENANALLSPDANNRRQVNVSIAGETGNEMVGVAVYDSSIPLGEMSPPSRPTGKLARMTAFAVASETTMGKVFTPGQLKTIEGALSYGALLDARVRDFERIRYQLTGLMPDLRSPDGLPIEDGLKVCLMQHPWLEQEQGR